MAKSKMMKPVQNRPESKKIALYRRVSTDKQREEGYSLDIQEDRLRAYVKAMDDVKEVRMYTDDGFSGGSLERPGIQRLISDIEDGIVSHVVVIKLDRLSRSQKDTLHLIEDIFIPNGVAFISIQESFNTDTPFGRAMIGILSVFAQLERENIYERTRSGMQRRVEDGYWPGGGKPPLGYDYDREQGILVPNEDAEKVRYIYDHYLAGEGLQKIADDLGLQYEKVAYDALTRKTNTGVIVYNGVEYKGRHEAIISEETYESAMRALRNRSAKKIFPKTDHLFTGMIYCGICGSKMRYQKWSPTRWKMVCYSRSKSKPYLVKDENCDNKPIWADEVDAIIIKAMFAAAKRWTSDSEKGVVSVSEEELITKQLDVEKRKLKRLYGLYAASENETLLETIQEVQEGIKRIEADLLSVQREMKVLAGKTETIKKLETLEEMWEYMTMKERRAIACEIVEKITITNGKIDVQLKIS